MAIIATEVRPQQIRSIVELKRLRTTPITRIRNKWSRRRTMNSGFRNDFYSTEIPNLKIILSERSRKRRGELSSCEDGGAPARAIPVDAFRLSEFCYPILRRQVSHA